MWPNDDRSYGDKEAERQASERRVARDESAYARLSVNDRVRTPDDWVGFVAEKEPDGRRVYVENWNHAGTYEARKLKPVGGNAFTGGL